MSSKGKQQVMSGLGRELSVALEGSIAAGKDAAVQAAEAAARKSQGWAVQAKEMRDAALKAASEAVIHNKASWGAKAEADAACARAVLLCACIALCELIPALLVLYFLFFR